MRSILFIGNFLSKKRGTKGIAERIAERHTQFRAINLTMASYFENKILRLLDITGKILVTKYDTVVIDVYSGAFFYIVRIATYIAMIRQKKIVLNLRGGKLHELEKQNSALFKRVMTRATITITPSLFLKDKLGKLGYVISYLPNFLDIEKFPYAPPVKSNSLLWVRAFVSIYNPAMAIRVLKEVRKQIPDTTLTMIGPDHGELANCIETMEELNLHGAVTIKGRIENSELVHDYHAHSVFLNTTKYESFGLAVLEAASCGIPVVSNKVGEIPYLWKESEEMLMCDQGNTTQMAEHVIRLLSNRAYAQNISLAARRKAEQFSWNTVKPKWQQVMGAK